MLQETQREENITKGTARSELRERRRTRRKSREKQEASLRKKEEDEVHDKKGRSNFTTFILSIRNCFSFLLVERKNIEIVDSAYSLYRFSFFFHEIIQTIEQYYSLLDLFSQLFPTVISNQGHSPPKEPINLDSRKSLFQRKYYYLQILHHLLFLCLNALLGYIVSYLLSQVDQAFLTTSIVSTLHYWHNFLINENLRWIQSSPIGIKLNSYIVDKTNQVITVLIENYIQFFLSIYYYPYCKLFLQFFFLYFPFSGITYQLSLLLDMVMMVTFPINVLYFLITHLAQLHYHLLSSLWLFFNGQKWNILRQRIDTYAYTPLPSSYSAPQSSTSVPSSSATSSNSGASQRSLPSSFAPFSSNEMYHSYYYSNQLLFGVLLFSIMFFLIPTVMIYYWFFVLLRVLVTSFYIAGWNSIMILKKFPCIYYCFYFFDYFFFTNRWHLEVDIPCSSFSASSFSSSPQRTVYPTDEKTVEVHRRKKSKITTAANVPLSKQPTRKDMMEQHSECSQPSEVSTDSEVNEKKGSQTMPPSKSLTPLKIDDNFTTDPASYLPDYPSPSHSHIHGNHRARNRKSLMMSLTEKYRKEEEEEQQQQRISLTQEINIPAIISAPVSSMGEESPSEDHGEIEARPKDSEVVGSFPLSLQPIKEPHSHEDDPFALNSSIYNDLQLSFSELSDEKTPREHAFSDQWDDSPAGDETSGNSIFKNGSPVPQSAILPSAIQSISMRFLPVNYDIIDLVIATFELFFTSPYTFSNHATDFDCYKNFTTRQRIFRFAQTISFSKPLYLIFEKNALRFTIFNPKEWNSIQTRSTSGYGDSIIVRKEAISSLRSLLSESDERRSLPFDDYYRKKVLSIICLIYSLYLLAFVWGVGSLLWNQMTWLYEIEASSLSASSNFEQIHAIKLNSMQNQTVGRALQEEIDLFSFSSLFYFFIGKK